LEKGGFFVRTVQESDARTKVIGLTQKGRALCDMHKQLMDKCDEEVQACLSEEEQTALQTILLKILDSSSGNASK
jgi:DNA-binding MarR family transcriptional regulator